MLSPTPSQQNTTAVLAAISMASIDNAPAPDAASLNSSSTSIGDNATWSPTHAEDSANGFFKASSEGFHPQPQPQPQQHQQQLDAQYAKLSEIAAMDASAAANAVEAEASLRRTAQTAHQALQTAHGITATLATQGEKLTAVEEAMTENAAEWHQGRKEMRRTRHWYVAFAHWLRCGGAASFRNVAAKSSDGKAAVVGPEIKKGNTAKKGPVVRSTSTGADEPLRGESTCSGAATCGPADLRRTQLDASEGGVTSKREEGRHVEMSNAATTPQSPAAARCHRLRGALSQSSPASPFPAPQRADVELSQRLDPGVTEVRHLVKEMHEQALLHNEMLTSHMDRLDSANTQADKTIAKNVKVVQKR